jgi:hypothetical protein
MGMTEIRLLTRLAWTATVLAAAHALVGIGISIVPNPDGWLGGIFYAAVYTLPLLLIGFALRSSRPLPHTVAGWVALLLAIFYSMVVVGNWSGYSTPQATFAVAITVPTVAFDLLIFWATILRPQRPVPRHLVTS